jgi:hypothetical protein
LLKAAEKDSDLVRFETLIAKAKLLNKYNTSFLNDPDFSRSTVLSVASNILESELKVIKNSLFMNNKFLMECITERVV